MITACLEGNLGPQNPGGLKKSCRRNDSTGTPMSKESELLSAPDSNSQHDAVIAQQN